MLCLGPKAWATAHQNWVATTTADCLTLQQKTPKLSTQHGNIPQIHHQLLDRKLVTLTPCTMEGATIHPDWNQHIFSFAGSQTALLCKGLKVFEPPTQDPAQHCVRPKKPFYNHGVRGWAHGHAMHWSHHSPHHPKAAGWQMGQSFEDVTEAAAFRGNPMITVLRDQSKIHRCNNQRVGVGVALLLSPPLAHVERICASCPHWIPDREHLHHGT